MQQAQYYKEVGKSKTKLLMTPAPTPMTMLTAPRVLQRDGKSDRIRNARDKIESQHKQM
jgi:hypothetical protein